MIITYYLSSHGHGRVSFKAWHLVRHCWDDYLLRESITKNGKGRETALESYRNKRRGLRSNNRAAKGYGAGWGMQQERLALLKNTATENASTSNGVLNPVASSSRATSLQVPEVDELQSLLDKAQTLLTSYTEETPK